MKAIQCSACKSYVPGDSAFCLSCGKALTAAARPGKAAEPSQGVQFVASLFVLAIIWGGYALLFGGDDEPAAPRTAAEIRQERIERGFSAWDGSHVQLTKTIKASMNDPDSYEHVETGYADDGDTLRVQTRFRGKNGFGGVVTQRVTAKVDLDGGVLEIISQE